MITIKQLLDKLKWDPNEQPTETTLHYWDNAQKKLLPVKYPDIMRLEGNTMIILVKGNETDIPLHRIRKVTRQDKTIWQRTGPKSDSK